MALVSHTWVTNGPLGLTLVKKRDETNGTALVSRCGLHPELCGLTLLTINTSFVAFESFKLILLLLRTWPRPITICFGHPDAIKGEELADEIARGIVTHAWTEQGPLGLRLKPLTVSPGYSSGAIVIGSPVGLEQMIGMVLAEMAGHDVEKSSYRKIVKLILELAESTQRPLKFKFKPLQKSRKTIYLIRHAESEQNTKLRGLLEGKISQGLDLVYDYDYDSEISVDGQQQLQLAMTRLAAEKPAWKEEVEMIVHSPLQRAVRTCEAVFPGRSAFVLDELVELVPSEKVFSSSVDFRMQRFLHWLALHPAKTVAAVGHGHYFGLMLGGLLNVSMKNVDVWKCEFDVTEKQFIDCPEKVFSVTDEW